jgi:VanZ family protein
MPRSKFAQAATLLVIIYWALLFVGTHVPIIGRPAGMLSKLGENSDKAAHCLAYAGLAFLLCTAASVRWGFRQSFIAAVLVLLMTYGAIDEWTQNLVPPREGNWDDWGADVLGIGIGLAAFSLLGEPLLRLLPRPSAEDGTRATC